MKFPKIRSPRELQRLMFRVLVITSLAGVFAVDALCLVYGSLTAKLAEGLFSLHVLLNFVAVVELASRLRIGRLRDTTEEVPPLVALLETDFVPITLLVAGATLLMAHVAPLFVVCVSTGLLALHIEYSPRVVAKWEATKHSAVVR